MIQYERKKKDSKMREKCVRNVCEREREREEITTGGKKMRHIMRMGNKESKMEWISIFKREIKRGTVKITAKDKERGL
jgi:hypothetical protein